MRDQNGRVMAGAAVTWASGGASIATVSGSGLVTAVAEGAATITAAAGAASGTSEITVENPDRAVLVALYEATGGASWESNDGWLTDAPLGDWYGVNTDDSGSVTSLDLTFNGLSGPIPPELGDLVNLTALILSDNDLSGPIPSSLLQLRQLEWLRLAGNSLCVPGTSAFAEWLQGILVEHDAHALSVCGTSQVALLKWQRFARVMRSAPISRTSSVATPTGLVR